MKPEKNIITGCLFGALCCAAIFVRCANPMAPMGGPRDSLPPVVVAMEPGYEAVGFTGSRIDIEFDEYVNLYDVFKEFYTSPPLGRTPTVTTRGRGIRVEIRDTLAPNTTYVFDFGNMVRDNNEGNILRDFKYAFSTGPAIDSLVMSGYTENALTGDSMARTFIFFFEAAKDAGGERDSTLLLAAPDAVGRAADNGIFLAEYLKPVDYRVYAVQDNNNNMKYEPGIDRVGFLDGTCNPADMPPFYVWYDPVRAYLTADPQLYFRMFMDAPPRRQYLKGQSRPLQNKVVLSFGDRHPEITDLRIDNADTAGMIVEYLKPTRDSIAYWFDAARGALPDTIRGSVTFVGHDSVSNLVPVTRPISLSWKAAPETREQQRARERLERARERAAADGEEPEPEPNPFRVKVETVGTAVNPLKDIPFLFDMPLISFDSTAVSLVREGRDGQKYNVRTAVVQDTADIRRWIVKAQWQSGERYRLEIPAGAMVDVAGQSNDTLRSTFTVMDPAKYAAVQVTVAGKTPESSYILQLITPNGSPVDEIAHARSGVHEFKYVADGTYRLRVVEDGNDNGVWDGGDLVLRRQPERTEIYVPASGDPDMAARPNFVLEERVDMGVLFAPVTMEALAEKLRLRDEARARKARETREAQQQRGGNRGNQPGGQGGGIPEIPGMGGVGGGLRGMF